VNCSSWYDRLTPKRLRSWTICPKSPLSLRVISTAYRNIGPSGRHSSVAELTLREVFAIRNGATDVAASFLGWRAGEEQVFFPDPKATRLSEVLVTLLSG
jgi:hypothetical protein